MNNFQEVPYDGFERAAIEMDAGIQKIVVGGFCWMPEIENEKKSQ